VIDWIEHNGGPQPVHEDVWLEIECDPLAYSKSGVQEAGLIEWCGVIRYRILNQHLIDAKQAEIDALKEDLAIWDSVFPDLLPDRLKSDKQLAEEDVAAKIDAARLEGIREGLDAAAKSALLHSHSEPFDLKYIDAVWSSIRDLNPDTIAREAVLDQLTREAQAQDMGYDHDDAKENTR